MHSFDWPPVQAGCLALPVALALLGDGLAIVTRAAQRREIGEVVRCTTLGQTDNVVRDGRRSCSALRVTFSAKRFLSEQDRPQLDMPLAVASLRGGFPP